MQRLHLAQLHLVNPKLKPCVFVLLVVASNVADECGQAGTMKIFRSCSQWSAFAAGAIEGIPSVSIGTIILIILVIALLGGFTGIGGGRFYGTGYYGGGGLGLIVVILLILLLLGRI